jgi:hypothetical protein
MGGGGTFLKRDAFFEWGGGESPGGKFDVKMNMFESELRKELRRRRTRLTRLTRLTRRADTTKNTRKKERSSTTPRLRWTITNSPLICIRFWTR